MANRKFDIYMLSKPGYWAEYDTEHSMCNGSCREAGDYCRCSVVTQTKITSVNIQSIVSSLFYNTAENKDEMLKYCIDRVLTYSDANKLDCWEVSVVRGYYGEETNGSYMYESSVNAIKPIVDRLFELKSPAKRILAVLEWEYGYLLDDLKNIKHCNLTKLAPKDIVVPQQEHYRKLNKDTVAQYKEFYGPICVCLKSGDRYRIIDGYHRLQAHMEDKKIDVLVLE